MRDTSEFCEVCNCFYFSDMTDTIAHHKRFHEKAVNGIRVRLTKNDVTLIQLENKYKLILLDSKATRGQINRLNRFSKVINASIRDELFSYSIQLKYPINSKKRIFLLCYMEKVIGYLDIEFNPTIWLVKMIWLAVNYRNQGLAKSMFIAAIRHLNLDLESVGWEGPFSKNGLPFVQSLYPNNEYREFQTRY